MVGVNTTGIFSRPLTKLAGRSGSCVVGGQAHIRQPLQQLRLHDRKLEPGQLVTQAEVRAEAEREVVVRIAVDIEVSGLSKTFSSKLADSNSRIIFSPSLRAVPWNSVSAVMVRAMFFTGAVQRSISSIALGSRSRSLTRR